jgi:hypothetical protein
MVHLDDVMTRREWDATGVARLRPEERAALEAWVQRYRDNARQSAASKPVSGSVSNGDVASTPAPVAPPTGYMSSYAAPVAPPPSGSPYPVPAPAPQYAARAAAPQYTSQAPAPPYPAAAEPATAAPPAGTVIKAGLTVQDIRGANRFISLSDGSMWDVYSADRGETSVWRIQDPVDVRTTTSIAAGYDREIVNASRNVLVRVKYVGQVGN